MCYNQTVMYQMLQQKVVIKPLPEEPTTVGKLFVPDTVIKPVSKGIVAYVGEGKLRSGDVVLFDNRQSLPLTILEDEYVVVHETQVFARVL